MQLRAGGRVQDLAAAAVLDRAVLRVDVAEDVQVAGPRSGPDRCGEVGERELGHEQHRAVLALRPARVGGQLRLAADPARPLARGREQGDRGLGGAGEFGPAASIGVASASSATRRGSSTSWSGRCGRYRGVPPMISSGSTRARRRTASGSTPLPSTVIVTSPTRPIATHSSPAEANSNGRSTPSTRSDLVAVTTSAWTSRSRRLCAASSSTSWASISESTSTLRESSTSWLRVSDDTGSPSPPPHPVSSTFSPSGAKTGKSTPERTSRCSASHSRSGSGSDPESCTGGGCCPHPRMSSAIP